MKPVWSSFWNRAGTPIGAIRAKPEFRPRSIRAEAQNIKTTEVLYPAPERYDDGFSESIVYHNGIVLPLRVEPENPDQAVTLSLDVFFGICNEICVPGEASLTLDLTPDAETDSLAQTLILRDLGAVPATQSSADLKISAIALSASGDAVEIEVQAPEDTTLDLFAAAPEGSYIGLPKPAGQGSERRSGVCHSKA